MSVQLEPSFWTSSFPPLPATQLGHPQLSDWSYCSRGLSHWRLFAGGQIVGDWRPGQWQSAEQLSLGKRYRASQLPFLPSRLRVVSPLTSKDQQCAEQGEAHDPSTEQWRQWLEVPLRASSPLYQMAPALRARSRPPSFSSAGGHPCSLFPLFWQCGILLFLFSISLKNVFDCMFGIEDLENLNN